VSPRWYSLPIRGGRIFLCHEGGYNAATVPFFGLTVMEPLSGIATRAEDPFDALLAGQSLQPNQDALIAQAQELVENLERKAAA
jgi:hypothetical protein